MKNNFKQLMREQVQVQINTFSRSASQSRPGDGWICTLRKALGISSYALAQKMSCSQSNVSKIEKSEKKGTISLGMLERAAQAMDCTLVYCFVPRKPLNEILEDQAKKIAKKQVSRINHSMIIEQQGLTRKQLKQQEDALVQALLQGNPRKLWREV